MRYRLLMKKFSAVILALLYISTSTGATLHMHYCMGKLADWGLGHSKTDTCGKCGMEKSDSINNGCCKDEHKMIKSETAPKATEVSLQMVQALASALPVSYFEPPAIALSSITEENPISNAPPRGIGTAIYKRNCVFRI